MDENLKNLEESIKRQETKKEKIKLLNDEDNYEPPRLTIVQNKYIKNGKRNDTKKIDEDKEEEENDPKKNENANSTIKIGKGAMYGCSFVSYSTGIPRYLFAISGVGLIAVSAVFSVVGSALGFGVGYYLMKKHCEDLLNQFELLFIQNAEKISDSLLFGINYLKNMANYYKEKGL